MNQQGGGDTWGNFSGGQQNDTGVFGTGMEMMGSGPSPTVNQEESRDPYAQPPQYQDPYASQDPYAQQNSGAYPPQSGSVFGQPPPQNQQAGMYGGNPNYPPPGDGQPVNMFKYDANGKPISPLSPEDQNFLHGFSKQVRFFYTTV